jgi:hypothetical protein
MALSSKHGDFSIAGLNSGLNPILHSFFFDGVGQPTSSSQVFLQRSTTACERLQLGVGGDGVVGRRVSVLDQSRTVVGEGIIGWG